MKVIDYKKFACFNYKQYEGPHMFTLGDIVINSRNEIGVIIQLHEKDEVRTDMFGNTSAENIHLATDVEIGKFRSELLHVPVRIEVIFYTEYETGNILAVFPFMSYRADEAITCYSYIGQHGPVHPDYLTENCTKLTDPEDYEDLYQELVSIGYDNLVVV